jgi:hypothetical protein
MTNDDIIRMAKESKVLATVELAEFAKKVAAHEREECAKVCEEAASLFGNSGHIGVCITNAGAIRARGNQ